MGMRRALCAAASSASGRAGTAHKSAYMCVPIVVETSRLLQLRLGGDVGEKSQLQLDDRSSATGSGPTLCSFSCAWSAHWFEIEM